MSRQHSRANPVEPVVGGEGRRERGVWGGSRGRGEVGLCVS